MPTLPLFETPADPDAWHRVTSPGGYEWWYFDAEDAAGDIQIVAIFLEGFVFHPGYLRRYGAYRRRPTRATPPVAGEYPCAYFVVYEKGRPLAQFMSQYPPGAFAASSERTDVRIGPNTLRRDDDDTLRLALHGVPWQLTWRGPQLLAPQELTGDLTFRPLLPRRPAERTFLSQALSGARHQWVIADPLCEVGGTIRLGGGGNLPTREIAFRGRGYHDHNYGTAPLGPGLKRWIWGRVLPAEPDGRGMLTFHYARPRDASLPDEVHLVEADADGAREVTATCEADWSRRSALGLAYPQAANFGEGLRLVTPRVVDSTPFYLRLVYDAQTRHGPGTAFCEVAYPRRLTWPILGRMIELSIHRNDL